MRYVLGALLVLVTAAGCGGHAKRQAVPDLRGERLDVAESVLGDRGLDYAELGGGAFGIVVRSHWRVCRQDPKPGATARKVRLIVARSCGADPDPGGFDLDDEDDDDD